MSQAEPLPFTAGDVTEELPPSLKLAIHALMAVVFTEDPTKRRVLAESAGKRITMLIAKENREAEVEQLRRQAERDLEAKAS